jgi:CubicO group peptidase (beta-lactamase class C family)
MVQFIKKGFVLIASAIFISNSSFAQPDTTAITAKLEQVKAQLGKNFAFALLKDGKLVYKREAGELNIKTQEYINASSQWLTAALVMVLVQEGKLSLDDKVSTYLPIFAKYGKAYITIRHCLTHNTGVDGGKPFEKGNFKTLEEEVDHLAVNREIKTNPGTEFYYSNIGFKIAARVLEVVSKKPFDRLMKEKLTGPLAMRSTTFTNDNYNSAPDPATGARSTVSDYLNFLAMLLNKGSFNGKQVLTESSVKILLSVQVNATQVKNAPKQADKFDYALGSWVMEKNAKDEPVAFAAPALNGIFAALDICRGYAFIVFTRENADIKKDVYLQIKSAIDVSITSGCK